MEVIMQHNKKVLIYKSILLKNWFKMIILISLLIGIPGNIAFAQDPTPISQAMLAEDIELSTETASVGIAWGDPDGTHSTYAWPFTVVQMGHAIQSYQNYGSAYFHHGIDMIAPNGTDVYNYSGGQVVNVENYTPGNDLYWEVAILDPEGYVWQYHHIDKNTIPQLIKDKFNEWKANPTTGGFIPAGTYIGDIVYWTVTSFGYRFNHIHLNILAAGDVYLNTMEFHPLLNDTQIPEIQAIGLLKNNTITTGNTVTGEYGLYVRSRDLFLSTVYYLPPYHVEFSLDGGAWTTVWQFHDLPGGASDTAFVSDFYVVPPTCGNYDCRDFYIDLGFTTAGQLAFPSTAGQHSIQVRVWDYNGNTTSSSFTWTVTTAQSMHVGDLDRSTKKNSNGSWNATVTIMVHDQNHNPISGVIVSGNWSNGVTGSGTCTTNTSGTCSITKSNIKKTVTSVRFSVTNLTKSGYLYSSGSNHDPEGESNGTYILISRP
jgi:hypothetical protein